MGSLMPSGAMCCSRGSVFTSVLMFPISSKMTCSTQRDQFRRFLNVNVCFDLYSLFFHLRDCDSPQYLFDAFIYAAQRLADGTAITLSTLAPDRDTGGNEEGPIDRANHLEG